MIDALTRRWDAVSLRTKVTGVTVALLTLGILVSGMGTTFLLKNYLGQQLEERLMAAAADWKSVLGPTADPEDPETLQGQTEFYIAFFEEDGTRFNDTWGTRDPSARPFQGTLSYDDAVGYEMKIQTITNSPGSASWISIAVPGTYSENGPRGAMLIALSTTANERVMYTYTAIFFSFGLVVVLIGAVATSLLVNRTFAPLRNVEATAASIAAGDFSLRLRDDTPNTEVGRLNRSLNTMLNRFDRAFADRARTIDQMRRFVGDASHELRTPLVTVRGYAELYRMGALAGEQDIAQAMERIEKEALRMGLLVEDLLMLARLDETRPLEKTPVDLVPIAQDAALDTMAQAPDRRVTVVLDLPFQEPSTETAVLPVITEAIAAQAEKTARGRGGRSNARAEQQSTGPIALAGTAFARIRRLGRRGDTGPTPTPRTERNGKGNGRGETATPISAAEARALAFAAAEHASEQRSAVVLADENKIRQVLANLIANALRFTPEGSPLELGVSVDRDSGTARLSVIDHGEGIPPQIREKIFERFWRADTSRTRETGGSGLGLAIVSAIVAAHRGRVAAEETPGGGATFVVTLPLLNTPSAPA